MEYHYKPTQVLFWSSLSTPNSLQFILNSKVVRQLPEMKNGKAYDVIKLGCKLFTKNQNIYSLGSYYF